MRNRLRSLCLLAVCGTLLLGAAPPEARKMPMKIWAADREAGTITEHDAILKTKKNLDKKPNFRVTGTGEPIPVGKEPVMIASDPVNRAFLLVANSGSKSVSRVDTATKVVTATYKVGKEPFDIEITPDARYALVANYKSSSISVIDLEAGEVIGSEKFGKKPSDIHLAADGETLLIAHYKSRTLVRLLVGDLVSNLRAGARGRTPTTRFKFDAPPVGVASRLDRGTAAHQIFIAFGVDTFSDTGVSMLPLAFMAADVPQRILGGPNFGVRAPATCDSTDASSPCDIAILGWNPITAFVYMTFYTAQLIRFQDLPGPLTFELGIRPEWFMNQWFSVHSEVGVVLSLVGPDFSETRESQAVFAGPDAIHTSALNILGTEALGFHYYFF